MWEQGSYLTSPNRQECRRTWIFPQEKRLQLIMNTKSYRRDVSIVTALLIIRHCDLILRKWQVGFRVTVDLKIEVRIIPRRKTRWRWLWLWLKKLWNILEQTSLMVLWDFLLCFRFYPERKIRWRFNMSLMLMKLKDSLELEEFNNPWKKEQGSHQWPFQKSLTT